MAISGFVNQTELLKTCMLILLITETSVNVSPRRIAILDKETLGMLLDKLSRLSVYGKKLRAEINNDLRNSIVHGRYWVDGNMMYYAKDPAFLDIRRMKLGDFIIKEAKRHNLISQAFIRFFPRWYNKIKKTL